MYSTIYWRSCPNGIPLSAVYKYVLRLFYGLLTLASEMDTIAKPSSYGCSYRFHLSGDNSTPVDNTKM